MEEKTIMLPRNLIPVVISRQAGRIFTIDFVKKDGSPRKMNCRKGVTAHLKGGENPLRYGNHPEKMVVFDMQKKAYRMINMDTTTEIRAGGKVHKVIG